MLRVLLVRPGRSATTRQLRLIKEEVWPAPAVPFEATSPIEQINFVDASHVNIIFFAPTDSGGVGLEPLITINGSAVYPYGATGSLAIEATVVPDIADGDPWTITPGASTNFFVDTVAVELVDQTGVLG